MVSWGNTVKKSTEDGLLKRFDTVFFDLDGTLTDPGLGITNSVRYALERFGVSVPDRSALYRFIGPPLMDSFREFYGFSHADAEEAVRLYRVYFREQGMFENAVYPGVPAMLRALRGDGRRLIVATSKPEEFAVTIGVLYGYGDRAELTAAGADALADTVEDVSRLILDQ